MRNRVYSPSMGRFFQPDPNATAMMLIEAASYHGRGLDAMVAAFDVQGPYGDGMNLYEYLGSSPWQQRDPLGLFFGDAVDAYATMGFTAGYLAYRLTSQYAENLGHDVDWATDWDMPDDWHTRGDSSWVQAIYDEVNINASVYGYVNPIPNFASGNGPAMGGVRQWQRMARAFNQGGQVAHHIVSWYKKTAKRFKELKAEHGFSATLWGMENMLPLAKKDHRGRHRQIYHDRVFDHLAMRLSGKYGDEASKMFHKALAELKVLIAKNPDQWFQP